MTTKIYRRSISGQPDIYVARGTLPISPKRLVDAMDDTANRVYWDTAYVAKGSGVLCTYTAEDGAVFQLYRELHSAFMGGMISPREVINIRVLKTEADGSINQVRPRDRPQAAHVATTQLSNSCTLSALLGPVQFFCRTDDPEVPELAGYVRATCHNSGMVRPASWLRLSVPMAHPADWVPQPRTLLLSGRYARR